MGQFVIRVLDCQPALDGFVGVLLAGPVTAPGDLRVGDSLMVTTRDGQIATARVTGFPLIRWGVEGRDWCGIMVTGVSIDSVALGHDAVSAVASEQ